MKIMSSFQMPTMVILENYQELDNICRFIESMELEAFHETDVKFPFKCFISYDFVNRVAILR